MVTDTEPLNTKALDQLAEQSIHRPVWLQVGRLIDGVSDSAIRDAHLVFDAKQIRYVGTGDQPPPVEHLAAGQSEPDAVLAHVTALPCLIDAHAHLFLDGAPIDFEQRNAYLKESPDWMLA